MSEWYLGYSKLLNQKPPFRNWRQSKVWSKVFEASVQKKKSIQRSNINHKKSHPEGEGGLTLTETEVALVNWREYHPAQKVLKQHQSPCLVPRNPFPDDSFDFFLLCSLLASLQCKRSRVECIFHRGIGKWRNICGCSRRDIVQIHSPDELSDELHTWEWSCHSSLH